VLIRSATCAAALAVLAGCGGGSGQTTSDDRAPGKAKPMGAEVPVGCEAAVPLTGVKFPNGLLLPPGARVIAASSAPRPDDPQVTVVEGYIEKVPDDVVATFRAHGKVEVLFSEDEGFESEVLVSDGRHRNFWKSVRVCQEASKFTALVADEKRP
jgi:hypothetical protein